jgi:hypothetical protein
MSGVNGYPVERTFSPKSQSKPKPDTSYSYAASPKKEKPGRRSYKINLFPKSQFKPKSDTSYSYTASPKKEKPGRHSYSFAPGTKEDPRAVETSYSLKGVNGYPVERTSTPKRATREKIANPPRGRKWNKKYN